MEWAAFFETFGKIASAAAAVAGGWWAFEKWRQRDEHFPRVRFEVSVNFVGQTRGHVIAELVASLENKGVVPLKIRDFSFKLLGLKVDDDLNVGGEAIRGQLAFPHLLVEGHFVPKEWNFTFVYPGVVTEYNFVCSLPVDVAFVRMQADFHYENQGFAHHAAKVLQVPRPA